MSLTGNERLEVIDLATAVARAMVDATVRGDGGIAFPVPLHRAATVTGDTMAGATATVRIDGDDDQSFAVNATGLFLSRGSRVLLLLPPPHGSYVIGVLNDATGGSFRPGRTGVTVGRVTNQNVADNTTAAIAWDFEATDTDGFIAVSADTITVPFAGKYLVEWSITSQSNVGFDVFRGYLRVSGGRHRLGDTYAGPNFVAGESGVGSGGLLELAAGDTIKLYLYWNDFIGFTGAIDVTATLSLYLWTGPA